MRRRKRREQPGAGRPDQVLQRNSARRAKFLFYATFVLGCFLAWRLYHVQIIQGPVLAARALEQQSAVFRVSAQRGAIYTSDNVLLARSLPSQSIYASPDVIADMGKTSAALGAVLGEPAAAVAARIREAPRYHVIAWKIPDAQAKAILALDLPGISVEQEMSGKRFLPSGRLASTILGFVGRDDDGLEGLEYEFDSLLRGSAGRMTMETDEFARSLPFAKPHYIVPPKTGYALVLTIDSYLQYACENVLRKTVKQFGAKDGTAMVMDPQTGALLAIANAPDYDVREFDRFSADARRDRAVMDAYEPGSTFKLVTAAAALESGKVTTRSFFPARNELEVGGSVIHNAEDGLMAGNGVSENLEEIIAKSHNVGAAEVGLAIGPAPDVPHDARLRLRRPDRRGSARRESRSRAGARRLERDVAADDVVRARHRDHADRAAARVRGDRQRRPAAAPARAQRYRRAGRARRVSLRPRSRAPRHELRRRPQRCAGSCAPSCCAAPAKESAQIPGYTTAGKTGTAQVAEGGRYVPGAYIASFVGFVPYEHPRYLILVKVDRPRGAIYGSVVAAPAFAEIARTAMLHAGVLPQATPPPERSQGGAGSGSRSSRSTERSLGGPAPPRRSKRYDPGGPGGDARRRDGGRTAGCGGHGGRARLALGEPRRRLRRPARRAPRRRRVRRRRDRARRECRRPGSRPRRRTAAAAGRSDGDRRGRRGAGALAARRRVLRQPVAGLLVAGVTGTNGKTTTTHAVAAILEAAGMPTRQDRNARRALRRRDVAAGQHDAARRSTCSARSPRCATRGARAVAMEVSSHALALGPRRRRARSPRGVLTNVTRDHLDFHGTFEAYAAAKRSLFDARRIRRTLLRRSARARVGARTSRRGAPVHDLRARVTAPTCGATAVETGAASARFAVDGARFSLPLPGRFNVRNALAALCVARRFGVADATSAAALAALPPRRRAAWSASAATGSTCSWITRTRPTRSTPCCGRRARWRADGSSSSSAAAASATAASARRWARSRPRSPTRLSSRATTRAPRTRERSRTRCSRASLPGARHFVRSRPALRDLPRDRRARARATSSSSPAKGTRPTRS